MATQIFFGFSNGIFACRRWWFGGVAGGYAERYRDHLPPCPESFSSKPFRKY
ncbi:MAG: hypothetical protein AVDCRST_MAG56-4616 [uncultured Cytophagales bacterium]|uniref:Uncharacterized protein n=1 Tax=uncultured Cytophagales bacterium TaxID=158755 RepID=A0A6J4JY57_9SPHI|nr:MAG: hypothetical protein AVDCRST_MAG56-4616 [uncultured Cytophagales bacterium]